MKNLKNVFAFTFSESVKKRSFIVLTVVMALVFFLAPLVGMIAAERISENDGEIEYSYGVTDVFVYDKLGGGNEWLSLLTAGSSYGEVAFTSAESAESARELADKNATSLILVIGKDASATVFDIVIPEDSSLTEGDIAAFSDTVTKNAPLYSAMRTNLTEEQLTEAVRVTETVVPGDGGEDTVFAEMLEMLVPLVYTFLLYFMLIFYGQGVATSIVSEKHSKLMDTLLISVKPTELILGKTLAVAFSGIAQLTFWLVALFGGFASGVSAVKALDPDTDMAAERILEMLSEAGAFFTPLGIAVSLLFIVFGFLLYCSLSAIGGAVSEKQEDLGSNNILFTGIMAAAFLAVLFNGPLYTGTDYSPAVLYIPFTSILSVPSQLLIGKMSTGAALVSLLAVIFTTVLISVLAGKLYRVFALYKGRFPGIKKAFELFKSDKASKG